MQINGCVRLKRSLLRFNLCCSGAVVPVGVATPNLMLLTAPLRWISHCIPVIKWQRNVQGSKIIFLSHSSGAGSGHDVQYFDTVIKRATRNAQFVNDVINFVTVTIQALFYQTAFDTAQAIF